MKTKLIVAAGFTIFSLCPAHAESLYVVGLSAGADSAEGRNVSALFDYSFTDATSITFDAGVTQAEGDPVDIKTTLWDVALAHDFGPVGVEASLGQWGDSDEFTSDNYSAGLFRSFGSWRISVDYLHRDLELTFRSLGSPDTTINNNVSADGIQAGLGFTADSGAALYATAHRYDYNRNVTRLEQFRLARLLSPSSLTLSGSLLDHSVSVGGDWPVGDQLLSLNYARDRTAVDQTDVDSLSFSWLTPLGERSDIEIGVGVSRDELDSQYFVSVLFLHYGGIE